MLQFVVVSLLLSLANSQNLTFTNPIFDGPSASTCILKLGDYYYLKLQDLNRKELTIYKSKILTSFRNVDSRVAFSAPDGFDSVEQNQVFIFNGELYLYFHMKSIVGFGVYVIKANSQTDPMAGWSDPIRLLNDWENSAEHGAFMKHNTRIFYLWTNISAPTNFNLFVAPMTSPTWVGNPKILLVQPREDWECHIMCVAERISFLYVESVTYMIYTVSSSGSPNSSLAQMSIPDGADPLILENWKSVNESVFWRNDNDDVYAIGRPQFTTSPDGMETWMVYQATISPVHIGGRRNARLEKVEWNEDGSPRLPLPSGYHQPRPAPSGQTTTSTCVEC